MAKHLDKRDIEAIVNLIRGWKHGRLTWDAICNEAESLVGKRPTRQSLSSHESIEVAYHSVKKGIKEKGPRNPRPSSLGAASARIANLERENAELKERNRAYKQLFVIWQYNAYKHNLKEHQLNEPMPMIDRERTDMEKR